MEWTWREQIALLLQCGGLGMALGIVYDWLSVWVQWRRLSRAAVFLLDSLFGLLAALATFFFALATMDGRLHPLLFVGSAIGLLVERCGISRFHRRVLYRALSLLRSGLRWCALPFILLKRKTYTLLVNVGNKCRKSFQNRKKIRKKTCKSTPKPLE